MFCSHALGSRHPAYDAQGMYLSCFRMLHILGVAACINHGKGGRVALWHKARHWWLPHSLGIFALVQGHAHSLEQPGQCRVATAYSLCVPSMRKLTGEPGTFSLPQPERFFTLQATHSLEQPMQCGVATAYSLCDTSPA